MPGIKIGVYRNTTNRGIVKIMFTKDSPAAQTIFNQNSSLVPGIVLCLGAAVISYGISFVLPDIGISPLIIAIVLGVIVTNTISLPESISPGLNYSSKQLLRAGIVLLGLTLVLGDIIDLGAPLLLAIVSIVTIGITSTIFLGKMLKVPQHLSLLIACGFSICGAAAVVGAAGVTDPKEKHEKDTVTAVALVVIFGTLMIPAIPLLSSLLGLDDAIAGMWAGGATHEVAQVVAIGSALGSGALTYAIVVKLARVLLLAPVVSVLSIQQRRNSQPVEGKMPPLVPTFILGFLAMVFIRSFIPIPEVVLNISSFAQTLLLGAAMFGLGCGVKVRDLLKVGFRPFILAACSTLIVGLTALIGISLAA